MPEVGRHLGSPEDVHDLRARGLLRLLAQQAREEAFQRDEASDNKVHRTRSGLDVLLRPQGLRRQEREHQIERI